MLDMSYRVEAAEIELLKVCEKYHLPICVFEQLFDEILETMKSQVYMPSVDFTIEGIEHFNQMIEEYNADEFRVCFGNEAFPKTLQDTKEFKLHKEFWDFDRKRSQEPMEI